MRRAVSAVGFAWTSAVAPRRSASSSLSVRVSTATIASAPAMRAAWITESPTPPQPMTATRDPLSTAAVRVTAPQPVSTAQPIRAARSSGVSARIGTATDSGTTAYSANEEIELKCFSSWPSSESRDVPSASVPVAAMRPPCSQKFGRPARQALQSPHEGTSASTT